MSTRASLLRRLRRSETGASAVEFALTLPVMLLILLGGYEYSNVIAVNRKLTITTRALADLITHYQTVSSSDVSTIMAASAQVMAPYTANSLKIVISEYYVNGQGVAQVVWSQAQNTDPSTPGQRALLPVGVGQPNSYLILCSTSFSYAPLFNFVMKNGVTLSDRLFMSPRQSNNITYQSS